MEGPSLFLAAEQLAPFVGKKILEVSGNTKIGKERLQDQKILTIFSFGKQLFFQFETFALRVHFLLFGSFQAVVEGEKVTGDYPKKVQTPRLEVILKNGSIAMYSCSIRFVELEDVKSLLDFTIDTMSPDWNEKQALEKILALGDSEIGDVLLDQTIFGGVGNIIKNEVLLLAGFQPTCKIEELKQKDIKKILSLVRRYVFQFYEWRKHFELKKHYKVYRQKECKICGGKVLRLRTGMRNRLSFICPHCQPTLQK